MIEAIPLFPRVAAWSAEHYYMNDRELETFESFTTHCSVKNDFTEDRWVLEDYRLKNLRAFIDAQIQNFVTSVLAFPSHTRLKITNSWGTVTKPGQSHHHHFHQNSIFNGVYYIDGGDDLPPIIIHNEKDRNICAPFDVAFTHSTEFNMMNRHIYPQAGRLLLFPGFIQHEVPENETQRNRRIISFNTFFEGTLGEDQLASTLPNLRHSR